MLLVSSFFAIILHESLRRDTTAKLASQRIHSAISSSSEALTNIGGFQCPAESARRPDSNRNHVRRSVSSIHVSMRLALAMS